MEDNRNWQGWAALALAGLALVIALFGRGSTPSVVINMPDSSAAAGAGSQSPAVQPDRSARPNVGPGWLEPQFGSRQQGQPGFDPGFGDRGSRGQWDRHPDFGGRHGYDRFDGRWGHHPFPFFAPFFLLFGLVRLAGIALLVWLLIKFFQGRRDRPSASQG